MQDSLKDKLKNLSPDQIRKLLASRNKSGGGTVKKEFEKMPRNPERRYPLSRAQERIWFLSYLFKNSSLYNIPIAVKLYKDVSEETLRIALQQAVIKNEILRTTFHEENGSVFQRIHESYTPTLSYEDISSNNTDKDKEVEAIALAHSAIQFDLTELPLFSAKLVKLAKNEFVLFLNLQHIISDGWTNALLSNDLNLDAQSARLSPQKEYGYIDFVKWEQDWMRSETYREQIRFWKEKLSDLPTTARFTRDFYTTTDSYEGSLLVYDFPDETWQKIHSFCKNNNYTAFQFFLVCFSVVTSVYTQEKDLIIGTPVANRNARYFHKTYGLFFNSLPMRLQVDMNISFYELMKRSIENVNQYMNRQEVPFTEIIKAVNPKRNLEENVLFNTHFAYQHFPKKNKEDEYAMLPIDYKMSKFDVNLWVEVAGDDCKLSLTYKNTRISKAKIERFLKHYQHLIDSVIENPEQLIRKQTVFPKNEISVLSGKNVDHSEESWLELFYTSLKKSPNAIAVVDSNEETTYSELNRKANALAALFQQKGINERGVVILDTGRNTTFIIGIIACFKSGITYLPIDSNIPEERLNYIVRDSKASAIFSNKKIEDILCISINELIDKSLDDEINITLKKNDIAYIIYTSGTTGKPKGVQVSHSALLNYTKGMKDVLNDNQLQTFAHVSAIQADLGNTAIFLALGAGAALLLPSEDMIVDPLLLRNFFKSYPADVLKIVPSHLEAFSEQISDILPIKLLICGGEAMSSSLLAKLKDSGPEKLRVINHYGPTETTIGVLTHELDMHQMEYPIPVGKPLHNTTICLMDEYAQPVPVGVEGEIYISGNNLANAYINDSVLTSEKFLELEGNRFYKTGDRGVINNVGNLLFLGRSDSQVKINGFRIELREIESILKSHDDIENTCVFLNDDDKIFAAVQSSNELTSNTLVSYMKRYVSELFVPTFSFVESIPLTSNGKIDYQQLKEFAIHVKEDDIEIGPRDFFEIKLLEFYKELFPTTAISIEDSFFDVGGHSLLAIQLMSKINIAFNSELVIANLFSHSSIKELAGLLRNNSKGLTTTQNPIALVDNQQEEKSVWIHPAGGNVMCYYPIATALSSEMDTFSFDYTYPKDDSSKLSLEELASSYFKTLLEQEFTSNLVLAGWSMGALIAHQMACLFTQENTKIPLVLLDQPATSIGKDEDVSYKDRLFTYLNKVHIFTSGQFDRRIIEKDTVDHQGILDEFIRVQLTPEETTLENFKIFLDTLVMHNEIVTEFVPRKYEGPVLLLKASENLMVDKNPLVETEDLGWKNYCSNLTIMHVPGNHITMMNTENSKVIASTIQHWLQKQTKI
ncbi:amino acid adenylation domain-containing protein [Flavobacteriaceae bacterium S356]|uniref:Amino acid adenylation domain-containing protein n=1 Tax=Asprobacillus argus TaxID=3076534 RepID=A0ABU3LAZ4_9FLAO|nr:amino acid adenylation domain-containing protein [Flavobacteriaceae bacterium S356]